MNDIVWVVNERDAGEYERDDHPMCVYPKEWSLAYAQKHWMLAAPPNPGFLGAFPGREWACLEAERRGCWGVLQLDDNITTLTFPRGNSKSCREIVNRNGGLAMFADILSAVALSTNGRMVGANLGAMPSIKLGIARPGFPYSCFIEKVGSGRESWYGPYEDDITHAFQYGTRADAGSSTALVVPLLRYEKESKSKSAMRSYYDHTRAVSLQKIFPEAANIVIKQRYSNGMGAPRIYHQMRSDAIRNKLIIKDRAMFRQVKTRIEQLLIDWWELHQGLVREKITRRSVRVVNPDTDKAAL